MSVIPQTPEVPRGFVPLVPYKGSALDPLGTLSGPQTHRLLTPPPLTTNPASAPGYGSVMVSVLALSAVYHGFDPRSGQTKDYKMDIST
jgi:hypothetical protein